jgi:hypothetical protein
MPFSLMNKCFISDIKATKGFIVVIEFSVKREKSGLNIIS